MAGRLPKSRNERRKAVSARLKPAQTRPDEANPAGFSPSRRAAQNKRVEERITRKQGDGN
jgi:hypothetical protein